MWFSFSFQLFFSRVCIWPQKGANHIFFCHYEFYRQLITYNSEHAFLYFFLILSMAAGHGDSPVLDDYQLPCNIQALLMTPHRWHLGCLILSSGFIPFRVWYPVSGILSSTQFMGCAPSFPSETTVDADFSMMYSWKQSHPCAPLSHCRLLSVFSMSMGRRPWSPSLILSRMSLYKLKASKFCCWERRGWLSMKSLHICPKHVLCGTLLWVMNWPGEGTECECMSMGFGNASPIN